MPIIEISLKQETPLIHFQYDEEGATLRASEVKPRLDKFILAKLENEFPGKGLEVAKGNGWLVGKGEHPALDYKLRIKAPQQDDIVPSEILREVPSLDNHILTWFENHYPSEGKTKAQEFGWRIGKEHNPVDYNLKIIAQTTGSDIIVPAEILREIKPKLDIFILARLEAKYPGKGMNKAKNRGWLIVEGDRSDLKYELEIIKNDTYWIVPDDIYFVNRGGQTNDKKRAVYYFGILSLMITCKNSDLSDYIKEHIVTFFSASNFGLRKSKGYGSFLARIKDQPAGFPNIQAFEDDLSKVYGDRIWKIDLGERTIEEVDEKDSSEIFRRHAVDLNWIYELIKSGITKPDRHEGFILSYFDNFKNEKYFIENLHINDTAERNKIKYIRGLLGVARHYNISGNKFNVSGKVVARFQSPITFRFYNNTLYLIAEQIPEELLDQPFQFSETEKKYNENPEKPEIIIKTPDSFNLADFIDAFVKYFNGLPTIQIRNKFFSDAKLPNIRDLAQLKIERLAQPIPATQEE